MIIDKPILDGKLNLKSIDNWEVYWEVNENYRHWCLQEHSENDQTALVVLFNPGKLNGNPNNLSGDKTLSVLREVFYKTGINPFIINLFDYCTPNYVELNKNWDERDYKFLVFEKLLSLKFNFSIYAYGLIDLKDKNYYEIISRINLIKDTFKDIPQLDFDNSKTTHPRRWQIEKKRKIFIMFYSLHTKKKEMIISLHHNL